MSNLVHSDTIRTLFSSAMSDMYRKEVPQYGTLIDLVRDVNEAVLAADPALKTRLEAADELERLDVERHGAIRLGTAEELFNIRRMFAVMGMFPVGYYDLSVAGLPVHSTAFRPVDEAALARNPFRVFTSLIRLELLEDRGLAEEAAGILAKRKIVTDRALELIATAEKNGGLTEEQAREFVAEALETFRWHSEATVSANTYKRLHDAHRLIADVVSFRGPHINHLTPRTLDIDAVQKGMPERGIAPKAIVEGPPRRKADILLRQTSFKALEEEVNFAGENGGNQGTHTARFGEIEQRGIALTPKGRALYDELLGKTRRAVAVGRKGEDASSYEAELEKQFEAFPDEFETLRREKLAYFRYRVAPGARSDKQVSSLEDLLGSGALIADPQVYEDFLPVSAAGIFQSNLGSDAQSNYLEKANQAAFEEALGAQVIYELDLYSKTEADSLKAALMSLGQTHLLTSVDKAA
ncbi:putative glyoxalase superfamily metalloenzyme YdcJ [Ciceribacter lividus]|uniref:2-oxoadipate dioxygenase/decarboxylase n=1 Tax=Ciceribacter lividus TaxID=1197950 RepID=A0A6I7HMC5_9HYPH|nr:VOC family protein [Ciceribacter lividus]RCW23978.1 putative glyoxalase superfamily metalloenzyme YdcJ [Ciceribacter lividus]